MPDEQAEATLSRRRGQVASGIKDSSERKKFIARQGSGKASREELETETSRERNKQALGSFKRGGRVRKTGIYKVHAGEKVIPAKVRGTKATPAKERIKRLGGKRR